MSSGQMTEQRLRPRRHRQRHWGSYLVLAILLIVVLFPVYYVGVGSIMTVKDLFSSPP